MVSGLAKLLDLFIQIFRMATPWTIVNSYERVIVLRLGGGKLMSSKGQPYQRVLSPTDGLWGSGLHLMIPFIDNTLIPINIVPALVTYPTQVFQSKDGTIFLTRVHMLWRVNDVVTFLLDVEDAGSVLSDAAAGITRRIVSEMSNVELLGTEIEAKLTIATRSRTKKFGVYVEAVYISELAPTSLKGGVMKIDTGAGPIG